MTARGWQEAFLAMSTVVGEPLEASLAAIDVPEADAAGLVVALRSGSRDVRARGLARALTPIVQALVEARLA